MAGLGILQLSRRFIFQVQFLMAILIETTNAFKSAAKMSETPAWKSWGFLLEILN